jgi:hypothetical protein
METFDKHCNDSEFRIPEGSRSLAVLPVCKRDGRVDMCTANLLIVSHQYLK